MENIQFSQVTELDKKMDEINLEPAKFLPFIRIVDFATQKIPIDYETLQIENNYQIFIRQNTYKSNQNEVVPMRICKQADFDKVGAGDYFKNQKTPNSILCPDETAKLKLKNEQVFNDTASNDVELTRDLKETYITNNFEILFTSCKNFEHDTYGPEQSYL